MTPSRLTRSPPSPLLLLGVLLLLGLACARRVETPEPEARCCDDVYGCLQLLADTKGPVQDADARSLPLERLDPLKQCAAGELERWAPEAHGSLVTLLYHPAPQVRSGAALALSSPKFIFGQGQPDTVPALLHALEQGPPELPLAALLHFDDARAGPVLRRYLQEGPTQPTLPCAGTTLASVVVEVLEAPDVTPRVFERGAGMLCTLTRQLVPRVRALLARELARPALWRSSDPSCQEPLPSTCQLVESDCMPYAGSLARALSGGVRDAVYPEFMEALARDDAHLTPLILQDLRSVKSPALDAWRARLLQSPSPDCRQHALRHIDTPPPQAREAIQSLLERGAPWERAGAAALLGRSGDDQAIAALRRALEDPHAGVQAAAVRALGGLKQKASAALPRLEELAATHPSPRVRLNAALARFWMTGVWKRPTAYPCPESRDVDGEPKQWELLLRSGPVRLRDFQRPSDAAPSSGPCAGLGPRSFRSYFVPVDQACLVLAPGVEGVNAETWVSEKGHRFSLEHWGVAPNPYYVLEFHGKLLLFHGLLHLSTSVGDVSEVVRTPQGGWMLTPFAPLLGNPSAYGLDSRGDLVVAVHWGGLWEAGPNIDDDIPRERSYAEAFGAACSPVVRITRDGQVFDVE